jgi:DHA2 family multidrug resistance protein
MSPENQKSTVEYGVRRVIITLTLIAATLLELIDTTIVNVAVPNIRGAFGAELSKIGWLIAAYTVATAIIVPITGWLSSMLGRRRYFVGSILLFTFASFMCGQSGSINEIIFWRLVQGVGGGALIATANAVLVEIYPDDMIGFANAMFGLGAVLGPIIGPVLGGYLVSAYSWPWIFYVNIPVGILAAIMAMIYIKEPPEKMKTGKFDWQGLALLIIGIGSLQIVMEKGADKSWFQTNYIIYLTIIAVIGILGFIFWEIKRAKNPVVDLTILKNREVALGSTLLFILGIGIYGSTFILPLFEQNLLGFSAFQSGISFLPSGLISFLFMPVVGVLMNKNVSSRVIAGVGFGVFALSTFIFSWQNLQSGGVLYGDFFWAMVLRGVAVACLFTSLNTIALSKLKGADIAQGSGFTNMARLLGGSIGLGIVATLVNYRSAFYRNHLASDISTYNHAIQFHINHLTHLFMSKGAGIIKATQQAYSALEGTLVQNVLQLTYSDVFFYIGVFFLACIPLLFFVRKIKSKGAPAGH